MFVVGVFDDCLSADFHSFVYRFRLLTSLSIHRFRFFTFDLSLSNSGKTIYSTDAASQHQETRYHHLSCSSHPLLQRTYPIQSRPYRLPNCPVLLNRGHPKFWRRLYVYNGAVRFCSTSGHAKDALERAQAAFQREAAF